MNKLNKNGFIRHFLLSLAQTNISQEVYKKVEAACLEAEEELYGAAEVSDVKKKD